MCGSCRADASAARKAIQTQYDRWSAAYARNDAATLLRILAPDFTLKTGKGILLKRGEYKTILLKRSSESHARTNYKTRIEQFQVHRREATAYTTETLIEGLTGKNKADHSVKTVHVHKYRDKWVLRNGQWLLRFSETLAER